jgi:formylglycine-generating enzyme required for sulfatase activity
VRKNIFISYRRIESFGEAQHLKTVLDNTFGEKGVFLDTRSIDGGSNWLQKLQRQVADSDAMVVLIGKDWANLKDDQGMRRLDNPNDFVRFEISQALLRNIPIVPVLIDGAVFPRSGQLPDDLIPLTLLQAVLLRTESLTTDAKEIVERLKRLLVMRRRRVIQVCGMGLSLAGMLAMGLLAGPRVLTKFGQPFLGAVFPAYTQLLSDLVDARQRAAAADHTATEASARRDDAILAANSAQSAQQSLSQQLATVEKDRDERLKDAARHRDEALKEWTIVSGRLAQIEVQLGRVPTSGIPFRDCSACPEMMVMPAGSFTMGTSNDEVIQIVTEQPAQLIRFSRPFAVSSFAVTFYEWDACVDDGGCKGYRPDDNKWGRGLRPVINVSWYDAKSYVDWLSKKTNKNYRLLSEAEREYVTRAGTKTPYWTGSKISIAQANYDDYGSPGKTVPVGSLPANPWGLYEVHGNVMEWVEDCFHIDYENMPSATKNGGAPWSADCEGSGPDAGRPVRGGSWDFTDPWIRSASREGRSANTRTVNIGFRVARSL